MSLKNSKVKIALLILALLVWTTGNWAQAVAAEVPATTEEYERSQRVVEEFCQAWINKDYGAMYQLLSQAAKERQSETEFTSQYRRYKLVEAEIIQHPLIPPSLARDGRMVIRVELRPKQEPLTEEASIVKSLELRLVFEGEGAWKVERIHVPIPQQIIKKT